MLAPNYFTGSDARAAVLAGGGGLDLGSYLVKDGTRALTADWPAGYDKKITVGDLWTKGPRADTRAYGASLSGTGSANMTALQAALDGINAGDIIYIPPGIYTALGNWSITKKCIISAYGAVLDFTTDANDQGLKVSASDVEVHGLGLTGPQYASLNSTQRAIEAYGADSSNYISGLKLVDCKIDNWGMYAIYMQFVEDFEIRSNIVKNINHGGIMGLSVRRGQIGANKVNNIVGTSPYGISLTRIEHDSLVTHPRSSSVIVSKNIVRNVTNWNGIGTHAGEKIKFLENEVYGCKAGIEVVDCDNGSNVSTFAPLDCAIIDNTIDSEATDGSKTHGIAFTGADSGEYATGIISLNKIKGHGDQSNNNTGGMYILRTKGLEITNNRIVDCSPSGITFYHHNYDFACVGNTIADPWSNTHPFAPGIATRSTENTGLIADNTILRGSKSATYVLRYGIYITSQTGVAIRTGINYFSGTAIKDIYDAGNKIDINLVTGGNKAVNLNYGGGTGGFAVYNGTNPTLASNPNYPLNVYDGAGTIFFQIVPTGHAKIRSDTARLYFAVTSNHYLHRSGVDIYWYDGSSSTKLNNGAGDVVGPATHSANYVPQWNATPNSKTLVAGFPITAQGKSFVNLSTALAGLNNLLNGANLLAAAGAILQANFGTNDNLFLRGKGSGGIYFGYGNGSGGVLFYNGATGLVGSINSAGLFNAVAGFSDNGSAGVDGSFTDKNDKAVTVSGGIITAIV